MSYNLKSLTSSIFIALALLVSPVVGEIDSFKTVAQTNYLELNNLLLRGKQYVEEQDYDKALDIYEQAASLDQNNAQIFSGIGYVQTLRKEYDAAIDAYEQAIALSSNNSKLYYALGYSLGKVGENDKAAQAYEKATELEPDDIQNYLGLGVVLLREQEYEQAITAYNKVLALDPDNKQAYKIISRILVEQEKYPEAIALIQQAIQQYPRLANLQVQLAAALLDKNDIPAALKALEIAKQTDPRNHFIYLQTGDALYRQQQYDAALVEYQEAAKLKLNSRGAIEGIGRVYLAIGNYLRATSEFRRLTMVAPKNPAGYHYLGIALQARKRDDEAIVALEKAVKLYQSKGNTQAAEKVTKLIKEIIGEEIDSDEE